MDHKSIRREAEASYHHRLEHYARGGSHPMTVAEDEEADKKMVTEGVHEHERNDHPGKPLTKLKLADGGCADGGTTRRRHDRPGRAHGGGMPKMGGGGRGRHGSHVNVIVTPGQGPARPVPIPVPAAGIGGGPPIGGAAPPPVVPRPPMAPPGVPMGGAPMPGGMARPPMVASGGMVRADGGVVPPPPKMTAGTASGEGRLQNSRASKKMHSAALTGPY